MLIHQKTPQKNDAHAADVGSSGVLSGMPGVPAINENKLEGSSQSDANVKLHSNADGQTKTTQSSTENVATPKQLGNTPANSSEHKKSSQKKNRSRIAANFAAVVP